MVGIGHRGDREVHAAERRDLARPAGMSISGVRTSYGQDEIREVARVRRPAPEDPVADLAGATFTVLRYRWDGTTRADGARPFYLDSSR
ncbi:hypothetical protein K1T35_34435 [Pseudonocardia sp. DSM 110487]|uniref:hypothetical protein n=1 Tax=Pseudonocardia sp. DSM 110487 TaxID=2865833 RepID=UPI001C6A8802|nr:hypothetical protein [Pseudonocardia sp. DSM 110487]QYN33554.1 hypothetical protein K1T35_34435 [Pseudonocardia sp. DSM 110487]